MHCLTLHCSLKLSTLLWLTRLKLMSYTVYYVVKMVDLKVDPYLIWASGLEVIAAHPDVRSHKPSNGLPFFSARTRLTSALCSISTLCQWQRHMCEQLVQMHNVTLSCCELDTQALYCEFHVQPLHDRATYCNTRCNYITSSVNDGMFFVGRSTNWTRGMLNHAGSYSNIKC